MTSRLLEEGGDGLRPLREVRLLGEVSPLGGAARLRFTLLLFHRAAETEQQSTASSIGDFREAANAESGFRAVASLTPAPSKSNGFKAKFVFIHVYTW